MTAMITCDNVSIRYITGDFKDIGIKEYLIRRIKHEYKVTEFWADRHVSFELEPGDMVGIIGSNGAGKSTLLKAISGIMVPTEGRVECRGKISALLELGSGFDGDLTVRENTYLRAAMLGYDRAFVDSMYDQIIDFAELRGFEDRPFKQLSSGMKSRLAFSIASLVEPEILILDEVLSVGDGAFRKKSEAKMRQIISGGATTLLVSHSTGQVRSLCNKILWLDHGQQVAFGNNVKGLCDAYEKFLNTKKLPSAEELPTLWVDVPAAQAGAGEKGAGEKGKPAGAKGEGAGAAPAGAGASGASGAAGAAGESAGAGATAAATAGEPAGAGAACAEGAEGQGTFESQGPRLSLRDRIARAPKAVRVAVVAIALLVAVIAVSEATLPGRIRALPQTEGSLMASGDAPADTQVCLWENRLFVFVPQADVDAGRTFAVRAVDSHGYVSVRTYRFADFTSTRFSTEDTCVLEVNLARFKGYVDADYGEVDPDEPLVDGEPNWLWSEPYHKGQMNFSKG